MNADKYKAEVERIGCEIVDNVLPEDSEGKVNITPQFVEAMLTCSIVYAEQIGVPKETIIEFVKASCE